MKNFAIIAFCLALFANSAALLAQSCIKVYGTTNISANEIRGVKIDSLNGNLTLLNSITSPTTIAIPEGRFTIDPDDQRIYLILQAQVGANLNYSLRVIEAQTGSQLNNFALNNPIEGLQYDCVHNRLFGAESVGGALRLVEINTTTGAIIPISATFFTTNNTNFFKATTISSNINLFSTLCFSSNTNSYTLYHISTTTGSTTNFAFGAGSDAVVGLEADKLNNTSIYLLRQNAANPQEHYLQDYNSTTNATIAVGSPFNVIGSVAHQSAFDPYGNRFFFVSTGAVDRLYTINSTTGNVLGSSTLSGVTFNLTAAVPCVAKPNFSFINACAGIPVEFNDLSVGAETWSWNFDDPASGVNNTATGANPSHTFSAGGTYNVQLNITGCVGSQDTIQQINVSQAVTPNLPDSIVSCSPNVVLDPGNFAGATYAWINGSNQQTITISNSNPLWYWVDITNGNCTVRDSVFVNLSGGGSSTQIWNVASQTICGEVQSILNTNGIVGTSYLWSTGATTPTITVSQSGLYAVTVTTATCTITDQININLVPPFNFAFAASESVCGGNKVLDATNPGAAYQWSTGAATSSITVNNSGTYTVTVSSSGCTATATSQVSIIQLAVALNTNNQGNLIVCNNPASVDIVSNVSLGGTSANPVYAWSTGATTANLSVPNGNNGSYTVTVSADICSTQATANVQFITTTTVDLGPDQSICHNATTTLDAGVGDSYLWSSGETTQQIIVNTSGTYTVTVSNSDCSATDAVIITVLPANPINFNIDDPNVCTLQDDVLVLNAGQGQSYLWSNGETTPTLTITTGGEYGVTVTDSDGCTNTQSIIIGNQCRSVLIFPNAFSPNEDLNNDLFKPLYQFIEDYHLEVYNIYGNKVFVSDNLEQGWDGTTLKSKKLPIGVYVWFAYYTDNLGNRYKQQGNVTLIR